MNADGSKQYREEGLDFNYIDTSDGFKFICENGEYKLIAYTGNEDTITLPSDIYGQKYVVYRMSGIKNVIIPNGFDCIDREAFQGSSVMHVVIPNSVTRIEAGAFSGCQNLTNVTIPGSIQTIERGAFANCLGLRTVTVEEGATAIGGFGYCRNLDSINIPDSVISIGDSAFECCDSLKTILISKNVKSVGSMAFSGSGLTSIELSDENEYFFFEEGVLYDKERTQILYVCDYVTDIKVPASVTSISGAFKGKKNIVSVSFEEGSELTEFGWDAFYDCVNLTDIIIPDGIQTIGFSAFHSCESLKRITIPQSVTNIEKNAFRWCDNLTEIIVDEENPAYIVHDGILYNKDLTKIIVVPGGISGTVVIPNGVTSISSGVFEQCRNLTRVILPDSIETIESDAFRNCRRLSSITIAKNVTSIEYGAFGGCLSLYEIVNNSLLEFAFGSTDFGGIAQNAKVIVNSDESRHYRDGKEFYYHEENDFRYAYEDGKYTLIEYIGNEEFVTLPLTVNGQSYSIYNMIGAKNVIIPNGITSIDNQAFANCTDLQSIVFSNSITSIGIQAFSECRNLTSITIPNSVTSIGGVSIS